MGLIIFIIASGLTLVFGLMDVLNFGHGVFIALGAFVATSVMGGMADWSASDSVLRNLVAVFAGHARGDGRWPARWAWLFERIIVRPVYGQHLKQILITMGGMIVGEELIKVIWGPAADPAAAAHGAARLASGRRRGDREVPRARGGDRADRLCACCCTC